METFKDYLPAIAIVVSLLGILVTAILTRGQRIKELTGEVHSMRARCDDLSTQITKMKEDYATSTERLAKQHDEVVKRQKTEIDRLHKEVNMYEDRDANGGMCSST